MNVVGGKWIRPPPFRPNANLKQQLLSEYAFCCFLVERQHPGNCFIKNSCECNCNRLCCCGLCSSLLLVESETRLLGTKTDGDECTKKIRPLDVPLCPPGAAALLRGCSGKKLLLKAKAPGVTGGGCNHTVPLGALSVGRGVEPLSMS